MSRELSVTGLLMMAIALTGLLASQWLFSRNLAVLIVQCGALVLIIWARVVFGRRSFHFTSDATSGGLITNGPYHIIRHPIYTGACVIGWAAAFAHWSLMAATLAVLLTLGAVVRMLCEERELLERYPAYEAYSRVTKRMIPYIF